MNLMNAVVLLYARAYSLPDRAKSPLHIQFRREYRSQSKGTKTRSEDVAEKLAEDRTTNFFIRREVGAFPLKAPKGTDISCKSQKQEVCPPNAHEQLGPRSGA